MQDLRKHKLIELGVEVLADALLNLAAKNAKADELIEHLIASPTQFEQLFKTQLSQLKSSRRLLDWRAASSLAAELQLLLQELRSNVYDPLSGAELVATFYEADQFIFEKCDDSNGNIGDLYRSNALELFTHYARRCADKNKIAKLILKLTQKDDYGVRSCLIHDASQYLSKELILSLIEAFQKLASKEKNEYAREHHLMMIESLARQIKDAKLFEKTRIDRKATVATYSMIDISRVYLESDDIETAYSWLQQIPKDETFLEDEKDELLIKIYKKQGESEKLQQLLFQKLREHHSIKSLDALLDQIGHNKRNEVITLEVAHILKTDKLCWSDVDFLIAIHKIDEAEQYLLQRAEQFNGNQYENLLSLVKPMQSEKRYLLVNLIYRSLLVSILDRAYTKAYPHAISYLQKLDKLSANVFDWKNFNDHNAFKDELFQKHRLKYSFWSKYDDQFKPRQSSKKKQ